MTALPTKHPKIIAVSHKQPALRARCLTYFPSTRLSPVWLGDRTEKEIYEGVVDTRKKFKYKSEPIWTPPTFILTHMAFDSASMVIKVGPFEAGQTLVATAPFPHIFVDNNICRDETEDWEENFKYPTDTLKYSISHFNNYWSTPMHFFDMSLRTAKQRLPQEIKEDVSGTITSNKIFSEWQKYNRKEVDSFTYDYTLPLEEGLELTSKLVFIGDRRFRKALADYNEAFAVSHR